MRHGSRAAGLTAVALLLALLVPAVPADATGPTGVRAYLSVGNTLVPLDPGTGRLGTPLALGGHADGVVIAPSGTTAWVLLHDPVAVRRIDLITGARGPLVPVAAAPYALALDPSGARLWVSSTDDGTITTVDTATSTAGPPLRLGPSYTSGIAFSADGRTAFVGGYCDGSVLAVDVATGTVRARTSLEPEVLYSCTAGLTLSPDGRTVWAGDTSGASGITPIDVATVTARRPYAVHQSTYTGRAVLTPDGTRLYTRTDSGLDLVRVPSGDVSTVAPWSATDYRVLPGGHTLLVLRNGTPGVQPLNTDTGTFRPALAPRLTATGLTVAPGQAPVARFTTTRSGSTVSFDARTSRGTTSPITTYQWRFGDGTSQTTSTARTTHTYTGSGYRAVLTVTDASGTSVDRVFDGQQLLRNGGPSAQTSHEIG